MRVFGIVAIVVAALVVVGSAGYAFTMFGPPHVAEKISRPEFCVSCHNMRPEYDAFQRSPHQSLDSCNECHLPNDSPVRHWFWDGVFGIKDWTKFNLAAYPQQPDSIQATAITRRMIQSNCERCHAELVGHINIAGRQCWDCHRSLRHRQTGLIRDTPSNRLDFGWAQTAR
jgi:cytochrome c nitrite reductase small subunit